MRPLLKVCGINFNITINFPIYYILFDESCVLFMISNILEKMETD